MSTVLPYFLTFAAAILYTEFVGYWLHILLHSEKVPSLSKAHMIHHLRDYGPKKPLHRAEYVCSASDRANFLGTGMEWILPGVLIVGGSIGALVLMGMPFPHLALFTVTGVLWGQFLFGYMHGSMHLTNFWMLKIPGLKQWYLSIRKLHDYHHLQITADGKMQKNYGICFFWFDRLFGTYSPKTQAFNREGYEAALERYKKVMG